MQDDLEIILYTSAALITLLIVTRIMGMKSMAQLTYFDYVVGITIGSIAATMAVGQLGIREGLVSLGVATIWVLILNFLTRFSIPARKLINSVPIMVIYKGQIFEDNLRKKYYNVNELLEQLREQGIFDPSTIEAAILETDGQLSVLKKPHFQAVTVQDLTLTNGSNSLLKSKCIGKELVVSGKIMEQNLTENGITREWLQNQLKAQGVQKIEEVTLAMLTPQGTLYIDTKNDTV